jgi:hypothetical protein
MVNKYAVWIGGALFFVSLMALLIATTAKYTTPPISVPRLLQESSVTVVAENGNTTAYGSGTLTNVGGESYVVTCAHTFRCVRLAEDKFLPVTVFTDNYQNGRVTSRTNYTADIIRISPPGAEDLALLHVRQKNAAKHTINYIKADSLPELGTEVYHVGSLFGIRNPNSLTSGIYCQYDRKGDNTYFDQISATAAPGSSGGGVFEKSTGDCLGILTQATIDCETINFIVPMRRVHPWAKRVGISFIFNKDVSPIPIEVIKQGKIEGE